MIEDAVTIASKYPPETLVVILLMVIVLMLLAIVMAFATGVIVPGKYLSRRFDGLERQNDRLIGILLLKDRDD